MTGFTSFVSHAGAPPYQVYTLPLGMQKAVFAGTSTIAFAVINAVKLVPYYALGQLNPGNLKLAAVLAVPAAALAVFAGVRLVNFMPEKLFFRLVTWALLAISLKLIWDGAAGAALTRILRDPAGRRVIFRCAVCARVGLREDHRDLLPDDLPGADAACGWNVEFRVSVAAPLRRRARAGKAVRPQAGSPLAGRVSLTVS
jgi:hypothetical protein